MYPGKYTLSEAEGDCSLTVHDVDIRLDDGHWQCQVIIAVIIVIQNCSDDINDAAAGYWDHLHLPGCPGQQHCQADSGDSPRECQHPV